MARGDVGCEQAVDHVLGLLKMGEMMMRRIMIRDDDGGGKRSVNSCGESVDLL